MLKSFPGLETHGRVTAYSVARPSCTLAGISKFSFAELRRALRKTRVARRAIETGVRLTLAPVLF